MARGLGTRMRRAGTATTISPDQAKAADSGVKGMVPVGRPFIDYLLGGLAEAGYTQVCVVTGPEHQSFRAYCDDLATSRIRISHAIQTEPRGTADAVRAAEEFAGREEFLVLNSDNYYPITALRTARELEGPGLIAFSAHAMIEEAEVPVDRVSAFPRVAVDDRGFLAKLVTSSPQGEQGYLSMNCWRFGPTIFEACRSISPSPRGELELPDAVEYSISRLGQKYRVEFSPEPVLDLSSRADIARVARLLRTLEVRL